VRGIVKVLSSFAMRNNKKGDTMKEEEVNFQNEQFNLTMIPGKFARAMRTCKIWQFMRFIIINIKMVIVVSKSH